MMSSTQCKMARAALGWSASELAGRAQVGVATVNRFEAGQGEPTTATVKAMEYAMEAAGVVFDVEREGVSLRKFREGDLVRVKPQYRFRYELSDEVGKILQAETIALTGPTYRVWVEFPGPKRLHGIFSFEFELVQAAPEWSSTVLSGFQVLRNSDDFDGVVIHCFDNQRLVITFVSMTALEDCMFPMHETIDLRPTLLEWCDVVECSIDTFVEIANNKYAKQEFGMLNRYGSTLPLVDISLNDLRDAKDRLRLPLARFSWHPA